MANTSAKQPGVPESTDAVISSTATDKKFDRRTLRKALRVKSDYPKKKVAPKPEFGGE